MNRRPDITGLSGIGILLLLASALGFSPISAGFLGVDVFFVCAGYLMTKALLKEFRHNAKHNKGYGWVSLRPFYLSRLVYFLPSALLTLAGVLLVVSLTGDAKYFATLSSDAIWAALMLANVNFMHQGVNFLASTSHSSPILNFWAISTYAQALAVFPLLLISALGFKNYRVNTTRIRHRKRAILGLTAITVVTAAITVVELAWEPETALFTSSARIADFAIGGLFAAIRINEAAFGYVQLLLCRIGALSIIIFSHAIFASFAPNYASIAIAVAAGFIAATHSARQPDTVSRILGAQPIYGFGSIALQVFLWYWPILVMLNRYGFHIGYRGELSQRLTSGAIIIVIATMAHFAMKLVTKPLLSRIAQSTEKADEEQDQTDDDLDDLELAKDAKKSGAHVTAYENRLKTLIPAAIAGLALILISAPSLVAPPMKTDVSQGNKTPSPSASVPSKQSRPKVVFIGASITAGWWAKNKNGWVNQSARQLHWQAINLAKPGTGFTHDSHAGTCVAVTCKSIAKQAVNAVLLQPDAVVVAGGYNDCRNAMREPVSTRSAIKATYETLRVGLPTTPIIALSVVGNQSFTIRPCSARINAWMAESAKANDFYFVSDVSTWLSGHPEYMVRDNVHPNTAGHTYITQRFVTWFRQQNIQILEPSN
jgi:peptidoglycan/LPS O-acetylase OafA/YrhL/lysophospholipase L1-like esterase